MNANILAVRALSAQFALNLLWPVFWIGCGVYIVVFGISWWLASAINGWWWLLAAVATFWAGLALVLWLVAFMLVRAVRPQLSARQKRLTNSLLARIADIPEQASTPKFLLLWRVVRDLYRKTPFSETYIGGLVQQPGALKREFEELKGGFR